jgi:hypothetical protein
VRPADPSHIKRCLNQHEIGWDIDGSFGNFPSIPITAFLQDRLARWWLKHYNTTYPRPTDLIIYLQIETRKSIMTRSLLGTCRVGG